MSYIALYRKWRPLVFEDVVEQEHVVKTLKYSVSTGRIAHAYLFCGTRGTGKTTMAHILSRAINCLNPNSGDPCNKCEICSGILSGSILDVLEIDAASNNSVDNIREIRDEVVYAPSRARYKVYIIDEVHMLSSGAFNALLKTLEEPPAHVVFILATTEPHKLPATILSRCQRFDFRRISVESIMGRLEEIAVANGVSMDEQALRLIARLSDGAMRDAISLLDQCISLGSAKISYSDVLSVVGIVNDTFMTDIVNAISRKDVGSILTLVEKLIIDGKDIVHFVSDIVFYYRNLLICRISDKPEDIIDASPDAINAMKAQACSIDRDEIIYIIKELSALEPALKWSAHPRVLLEVSLIKLCESVSSADSSDILKRLSALEAKMSSGNFQIALPAKASHTEADAEIEAKARVEQKSVDHQGRDQREKAQKPNSGDKAASKNALNPVSSLENWDKVLNELKSSGRMALYTYLLNTKAVELDDKFVGIVFKPGCSFNKMIVSKAENVEIVENVLDKSLGREVRIKCLDEEDLGEIRPKKQFKEKDDFLEKAQDLAKRLNVPINMRDE